MRNGITGLRAYQQGGPVLDKLRSLWEGIRGRADDPSLGYIGASMLPGIGEATDLVEIGAGLQDRSLGRVGLGLAGLALPFVGAAGLRKLLKGRRKLPMDEARRLKREALGIFNPNLDTRVPSTRKAFKAEFDVDAYHGTDVPMRPGEEWTSLEPSGSGMLGPGIYSGNPGAASGYAVENARNAAFLDAPMRVRDPSLNQPRIYPIKVRGKKLLQVDRSPGSDYMNIVRELDTRPGSERLRWSRDHLPHPDDIANLAKELGYEGLYDGTLGVNATISMFDPKNIRSPWAAFDPAKAGSRNLLAGIGGLAGAGYMSNALREDNEY